MRAVIQKVNHAKVIVKGAAISQIGRGLLVYIGFENRDQIVDIDSFIEKIISIRIFPNMEGKMDLTLNDVKGSILLVSQFTLMGDCNNGRRPNFTAAAKTDHARQLYEYAVEKLKSGEVNCAFGEFQSHMEIVSSNDGPITLILESKKERNI